MLLGEASESGSTGFDSGSFPSVLYRALSTDLSKLVGRREGYRVARIQSPECSRFFNRDLNPRPIFTPCQGQRGVVPEQKSRDITEDGPNEVVYFFPADVTSASKEADGTTDEKGRLSSREVARTKAGRNKRWSSTRGFEQCGNARLGTNALASNARAAGQELSFLGYENASLNSDGAGRKSLKTRPVGEKNVTIVKNHIFLSDVQWLICSCVLMATAVLSCRRSEFQCNNGHCIASNKVCNVVDDCGDGSDEERRRGCGCGGEDKYDQFFVPSPATLLISFHLSGPDRSPS
ncbi:LOW QUALITY PROTEIN: hypothetical protein V1478_018144 [Vespula squamosa]|uniref:Uncharacterized protein n=1 Tax=Vespula squamosa TaxID=30214 RepID=A0ABD1ZW81_VESSQ